MTKRFSLQWTIAQEDEGKLIKQFLKEKHISKAAVTDIKYKGGNILVNDEPVNVLYKLKENEILTVFFPEEKVDLSFIEKIPLAILYEDDYILIVNKPAGMSTIPSREHPHGSLANALIGYYQDIGISASPHIVTRLDRNTSGVVVVAKYRHVHHLFGKQMNDPNFIKEYIAFVEGKPQPKEGVVEEPIGRKEGSIIERTVTPNGQYAKTRYQVLEQYEDFAIVKLYLETGRTHQIRVHMSYIGHPLVGDDLYGGSTDRLNRQALHCYKVSFSHPITNEIITVKAELPEDMETFLKEQ